MLKTEIKIGETEIKIGATKSSFFNVQYMCLFWLTGTKT